jgi:oligosaccharide repeat unit polymerase
MVNNSNRFFIIIFTIIIGWLPIFASLAYEKYWIGNIYNDIHFKTIFVNILGIGCVIIGAFIAKYKIIKKRNPLIISLNKKYNYILYIVLFLSVAGGIYSYYLWRSIGINFLSFAQDMLYRMNVVYADEGNVISGFWGRLSSLGTVGLLYIIYLYINNNCSRKKLFLIGLIFLLVIFSPRRAAMFTTLIASMYLYIISKDVNKYNKIIYAFLFCFCFCFIFVYTQYTLGKITEFSISDSIKTTSHYLVSNIYVMDGLINTSHFQNTWIILSVPARVFSGLFGVESNVDLSIPFIYLPEPSNTVPMFYYFFKSSGYYGVLGYSLFVGYITMVSINEYITNNTFFSAVCCSLFLSGILLSVRDCIFITYDFYYWLLVSYLINIFLDNKVVWAKKY